MNKDHWTVCVKYKKNATTFYGPFAFYINAYWWAMRNIKEAYEIRFQDMSPYRK